MGDVPAGDVIPSPSPPNDIPPVSALSVTRDASGAQVEANPVLPSELIYYEGANGANVGDYDVGGAGADDEHRIDMAGKSARRLAITPDAAIHVLLDSPTVTYSDTVLDAVEQSTPGPVGPYPDLYLCPANVTTYIPYDDILSADLAYVDMAAAAYGTDATQVIIEVNP